MCGIVGIVDTRERRPVDPVVLRRMNESQHHRGPDEGGFHLAPGVGLGHRRLSIIDLATGQQPLYNEDGTVVVVYNGEIYNFNELIPELTALGHRFRTKCDTEVIVHAWEQWGEKCVERFRGMFAFGLWDEGKQTLFLARDRLGVKPLYYAQLADGTLIFGSELKSLLAHGAMPKQIDPRAVETFFALGYVAEPDTVFLAARKLAPGHTLAIRRGTSGHTQRRYWDVHFSLDLNIQAGEACEELVQRLDEAVRLRMIAEVPLGAFLSGGVDSSAVVASMARASNTPVKTCSIAFNDPAYDESKYADLVARRYNTNHFVDRVDSDDFDLIDELAGMYDEPFADSSAIPTYRVCQLARRHVTVALSGDGGDETFGGYRRYQTFLAEQGWRDSIPGGLRRTLMPLLARLYPAARSAPRFLRAKASLQAMARDAVDAYLHEVSILHADDRARLFTPSLRASLGGYSTLELFRDHASQAQTEDPLALVQYLDLKTYLVGDINTKVDRASMAHSLEVREPLMDHKLMEWMARVPSSLKIRDGEGKFLFKRALEPQLPDDVLYRRKMGFAVPLAAWFRGPLRTRMHAMANSEVLLDSGLFSPTMLRTLVNQHETGARDWSAALWSISMFEAFLRRVSGARTEAKTGRSPVVQAA